MKLNSPFVMKTKFAVAAKSIALLLLLPVAVFCADPVKPAVPEKPAPAAPKKITADEAEKMIKEKKVIVLDVRTPQEFAAGHIAGSTNLNIRSPDFEKRIQELDKNQAYLVHCARGGRSAAACEKMKGLQFKALYDFSGSFGPGLKAAAEIV